jgi:potassium-transporting ATPase KdpC subunit
MAPSTSSTSPSPAAATGGLWRPALVLFVLLSLATGLAYPLLVTGIAQLALPRQANGSLIVHGDRLVGSSLVGQHFQEPGHFWGRPSATGPMAYNASASAGSNRGPLHPALADAVKARVAALRQADPGNVAPVPVDLVTASASGLDPHISRAAADYQAARVARARGLPEPRVRQLVEQHTEWPLLGFLGEPRVHVLRLNLALEGMGR